MHRRDYRKDLLKICFVAGSFCFGVSVIHGQGGRKLAPSSTQPPETSSEIRELSELIHDLQSQVQTLNSQLTDLRTAQQKSDEDTRRLRRELDLLRSGAAPGTETTKELSTIAGAGNSSEPPVALSSSSVPQEPNTEARISKLEEDQEITDTRLNEQNQTKVESGSKYRLRLSGMVLLNLYGNRGLVDNQDFPLLAEPPQSNPLYVSSGSFGGSLRQSEIKLETFGPDLFGARTSANLEFDFAGGFANTWNGAVQGIVRLRTGTIRLDWTNTSIVAGQDHLFFAPLAPTSLATLATPALSYAGNLWSWTPQVRIEHRLRLSESSNLELQAGILDSLTGDPPSLNTERLPSWGEESGQPAYATRISWNRRAFGQNIAIGFGGYYGREDWGFNRTVDGWAGMTDVTVPLGKRFEFTGEFYRGRAVAGLGGAIGQPVVLNGSFIDPATRFMGLDSMGGWAQLKYKPKSNFEINVALGIDNPFAGELRKYNSTSIYDDTYTRNLSPLVNFIYQIRSDILFSLEYRYLDTTVLDSGSNGANHINMSLGYIF